jgi:tRNA(fMet)-specific endonuclease VapC
MILLDTDHTTFLKYPDSVRGRRMIERLNAVSASEVIGVGIVTVEERMRGWLAVIAKEKSAMQQVVGYRELALLFEFYQEFEERRLKAPMFQSSSVHQCVNKNGCLRFH